jgi:hypothetical protein
MKIVKETGFTTPENCGIKTDTAAKQKPEHKDPYVGIKAREITDTQGFRTRSDVQSKLSRDDEIREIRHEPINKLNQKPAVCDMPLPNPPQRQVPGPSSLSTLFCR